MEALEQELAQERRSLEEKQGATEEEKPRKRRQRKRRVRKRRVPRAMRMLTRRDLRTVKGIPYSRQHIVRLISLGKFPEPDGRISDRPTAPSFWLESTVDEWIRNRPPYRRAKFPAQLQKEEATP